MSGLLKVLRVTTRSSFGLKSRRFHTAAKLYFPKSYHIVVQPDGMFIWPACGFGEYCLDEQFAKQAFKNQLKNKLSEEDGFELVSYDAVISNGIPIGITGEKEIIEKYNC